MPVTMKSMYDKAISFVALNDEPTDFSLENIAGYTTVLLISEAWDFPDEDN